MASVLPVLEPRDLRPEVQRALRVWLSLQAEGALRPRQAVEALHRTGDPERALRVLMARPRRRDQIPVSSHRGADGRLDLRNAMKSVLRSRAVAIPLLSPAYPPHLARLPDAALLLWVRGEAQALSRPGVAIVGARAATRYGRQVARGLGEALAREEIPVISGLARGVDAEAHQGCLEAGGITVAVQGCGPDRVFPAAHERLAARITARGAVVSELPPGSPPLPHHFPLRNRLISGLAACVVVVEARARSGSLSTARHALDQGADVLAVPGPIDAPTSVGTNRLLREGAAPVLDVTDVLQSLGLPLVRPSSRAGPPPSLGAESTRGILKALCDAPATLDELVRRLGRTPEELARELLELELQGCLVREPDGSLRITSAILPADSDRVGARGPR